MSHAHPADRYLTDAGIEYLRTYLNVPSEVVPATLKKSAQPASRPAGFGGREGGAPRGDGPRGYDREGYRGGGFGRGEKAGGAPGGYAPRFGGGEGGGFGRGRA